MILRYLIVVLLAVAASPGQSQAQDDPLRPTLNDFLSRPDFWGPDLSPSGRFLAAVTGDEHHHQLVFADLSEDTPKVSRIDMDQFHVDWVKWATDDRVLIAVTGYMNMRTRDPIDPADLAEAEFVLPYERLFAVDRDATNMAMMWSDNSVISRDVANIRLYGVTSFLPNDPDHILMPAARRGDLDLFRLNIHTGASERIAQGTGFTYAWFVDAEGEPAFRLNTNSRGTVVRIYAREDRKNGKIKWRKIRTLRLNRDRDASKELPDFQPLAPGPSETTYYVSGRRGEDDKIGVHLYDFETGDFVETLARHDEVDVYDGIFDRETGDYVGSYYYDDKLEFDLVDKDIQAHMDGLDHYFGGSTNVVPAGSSQNGEIWLLYATGPAEPGSYHVYNVKEARAREINARKSAYVGRRFAETETIRYTARDGLALRGYLTRPIDAAPGDRPPLIVMPHGGPESRDWLSFDPMVQFLTARGYQVFQPNFRGSSGFGQGFADAGRRQWGRLMQTDIEDGFQNLVEAGFADPDRACIFGYSYGGYAAMAAATLTPDLYQCVIAVAGISDLEAMLKSERREEGRDSESFKYWVDHIGDPKSDLGAIRAVSPARLADRATRPILLMHGDRDRVVLIEQSEIMRDALTEAGKEVEYLVLKNAGHSYRSDAVERQEYEKIGAFLSEHLPVETKTAEPSGLEAEQEG